MISCCSKCLKVSVQVLTSTSTWVRQQKNRYPKESKIAWVGGMVYSLSYHSKCHLPINGV